MLANLYGLCLVWSLLVCYGPADSGGYRSSSSSGSRVSYHRSPVRTHGSSVRTHGSSVRSHGSPVSSQESPVSSQESPVSSQENPFSSLGSPVRSTGSSRRNDGASTFRPTRWLPALYSPIGPVRNSPASSLISSAETDSGGIPLNTAAPAVSGNGHPQSNPMNYNGQAPLQPLRTSEAGSSNNDSPENPSDNDNSQNNPGPGTSIFRPASRKEPTATTYPGTVVTGRQLPRPYQEEEAETENNNNDEPRKIATNSKPTRKNYQPTAQPSPPLDSWKSTYQPWSDNWELPSTSEPPAQTYSVANSSQYPYNTVPAPASAPTSSESH